VKQSDNKRGFTQVGNYIFDVILPSLSLSEQAILLRVVRQTVGWSQPTDKIKLSEFRQMTGIKDDKTVRAALDKLVERQLITVTGKPQTTREYGMNYDTLIALTQRWYEDHTEG